MDETKRQSKSAYLREWRARRTPEQVKEANRRAYEKLKADPEKYKAHALRMKLKYIKKPKREPRILTDEERAEKCRLRSIRMKQYWANNPDKYREHVTKCATRNKEKRMAASADI